jgi:hypothetical protein
MVKAVQTAQVWRNGARVTSFLVSKVSNELLTGTTLRSSPGQPKRRGRGDDPASRSLAQIRAQRCRDIPSYKMNSEEFKFEPPLTDD